MRRDTGREICSVDWGEEMVGESERVGFGVREMLGDEDGDGFEELCDGFADGVRVGEDLELRSC